MSITTLTGRDTSLAAPLDAVPVDPTAQLPEAGQDPLHRSERVKLKPSVRAFRGREVEVPDAQDSLQIAQDLVAGRVAQARYLAEGAPHSIVAASRLAHTLLLAGHEDDAAEVASAALALDHGPATADKVALFVAARVLASAERAEQAEQALSVLPADGPWSLLYASLAEQRGDLDEALARVEGSTNPDSLAYSGYLMLLQGRPQPALHSLRAAQSLSGPNPALLINQAYAFALLGSLKKAVRAAQQATALAPQDLTASFNLANYLRAFGRPDLALDEMSRLATQVGTHPLISSAKADILLGMGNLGDALRELRRATHHTDESQSSSHQAELRANIAVLEWVAGKRDRKDCLRLVTEEIRTTGPQVSLACIIADLATERSDVRLLETLVTQLREQHTDEELLPVTTRLAYLRGDYVEAAELSVAWSHAYPLDAQAARAAVFHVGQSCGEYSRAGDLGLSYLRRLPRDVMLANNTAFALGLAGRHAEAERLLKDFTAESVFLTATRGLLEFAKGNVAAGLAGYDLAEALARSNDARVAELDPFLACMRVQETLVIYHFGLATSERIPEELKRFSLPNDWTSDLRFKPFAVVAKRLPAPWPAS